MNTAQSRKDKHLFHREVLASIHAGLTVTGQETLFTGGRWLMPPGCFS